MKDFEPLPVKLRWLIRRDMAEVLDIEAASFAHPWNEKEFIRMLRERNTIGRVAECTTGYPGADDNPVAGYVIYELRQRGIYLHNFAVHPDNRRRGVGREMMGEMIRKLSNQHRPRLQMHVADTNLDGHLFLKAMGLRAVGVVAGHYEKYGQDGYLFQFRVPINIPQETVK